MGISPVPRVTVPRRHGFLAPTGAACALELWVGLPCPFGTVPSVRLCVLHLLSHRTGVLDSLCPGPAVSPFPRRCGSFRGNGGQGSASLGAERATAPGVTFLGPLRGPRPPTRDQLLFHVFAGQCRVRAGHAGQGAVWAPLEQRGRPPSSMGAGRGGAPDGAGGRGWWRPRCGP